MAYRSNWNKKNELRCLIIFKKLELKNFSRNQQMAYCREMEQISNLDATNISAKVSNYKSVAGVNNSSNASQNTIQIFNKYNQYSIKQLEAIVLKTGETDD